MKSAKIITLILICSLFCVSCTKPGVRSRASGSSKADRAVTAIPQWNRYGNYSEFQVADSADIPTEYSFVDASNPSPFAWVPQFKYSLPRACDVTLELFNISEKMIDSVSIGYRQPGSYIIRWE